MGELEQVKSITAAQSAELTGAKLPSVQLARSPSAESVRQLSILLEQMAAGFPYQELPPETAEIYQMAFEDLVAKYGVEQIKKALRAFLTRQKWFPHPAEVAEELEIMAKEKQQQVVKALPTLGCELCRDGWSDGWILELDPGGNRRVKKCECMLARERAKKKGPVC